jgi:RNA polymerase sigma factor (sigma-70 family)
LKPALNQLLADCKAGKSKAQSILFDMYERKFFAMILRYVRTTAEAEDVVIQGFTKIFSRIDQYKEGSFEGWMKTIVIHEALSLHKKNAKQTWSNSNQPNELLESHDLTVLDALSMQDLSQLIKELPEGSKMVFNLFAIEGYGHKEIAEMLDITEGTSKSQFARAKALLKNKLTPTES